MQQQQQVFFSFFFPIPNDLVSSSNIATRPDLPPHHTRLQEGLGSPSLTSGLGLHFVTIRLNRMCVWRGARPALRSAALSKACPVLHTHYLLYLHAGHLSE